MGLFLVQYGKIWCIFVKLLLLDKYLCDNVDDVFEICSEWMFVGLGLGFVGVDLVIGCCWGLKIVIVVVWGWWCSKCMVKLVIEFDDLVV